MSWFYKRYPDPKYKGLLNQGSTCYLNSVLQVLFMTDDFREAVDRHAVENPDTGCVDRQLKSLFDDLKQHNAYTYMITKKLGIQNVYEQRDAAEYYERILSLTSAEASQVFHGQLTHRFICVCGTKTNTHDAFWSLPLALTDSASDTYNVVHGIREFFRDSEVKGENQLYCDTCDSKADATVKCEVEHHPEVLMLLLKRFEFNYQYMRYVKINCSVEIPRILQIPKDHFYELYAIVDHSGDLRSGHYTATIQCQDDKTWYEFNDADVRPASIQLFQENMTMTSYRAYLLFYKKVHEDIIQDPPLVVSPQDSWHKEIYEREKMTEVKEAIEVAVDKKEDMEGMITDLIGRKGGRMGEDEGDQERERLEEKNEEGVTCSTHRLPDMETRGGDEGVEEEGNLRKKVKEDEEQKGGDNEGDDLSPEIMKIPLVQRENTEKEDKKQKRGQEDGQRTETWHIPGVPPEREYRRWIEKQGVDSRPQVTPCVEYKNWEDVQYPESRSYKTYLDEYVEPWGTAGSHDAGQREIERKDERSNANMDKQVDQERTVVESKAVKMEDVHEPKTGAWDDNFKSKEHWEYQQNVGVRQTKEERVSKHGNGDEMEMKGEKKHADNREVRKDLAVRGQQAMDGQRGARDSQRSERSGGMKPQDGGQIREDDQQDAKSSSKSMKEGQRSEKRSERHKIIVKITEDEDKKTPTGIQHTEKESVREMFVKVPQSSKKRKGKAEHDPEQRGLTTGVTKLKIDDDPLHESVRKRKRGHEAEASERAVKRATVQDGARKRSRSCLPFKSLFKGKKGAKGTKRKGKGGSGLLACFAPKRTGQTSESE